MEWWQNLEIELTAFFGVVFVLVTIPWVLTVKKEATSAVAWCLLVFFLPFFGTLFFVLFGYQHIRWPLRRKQRHKKYFRRNRPSSRQEATPGVADEHLPDIAWRGMAELAQRFGAFPMTSDNEIAFYYQGQPAFNAMLEAIRAARHHIHLETFIFQRDATGQVFLDALAQKAREGVEVRLLYDAMGSYRIHRRTLQPLRDAGGKASAFLPLNPLRRRIQVNMRDHRKILVVDGRVAFTGGLNIGDEYLGKNLRFGFWRDTHLRLEGSAVAGLQYVFLEDWDFAAGEYLQGPAYFPEAAVKSDCQVQVIHSGPEQEPNSIREIYFAAMQRARQRLWIASPYFVPDAGLRDALCLAGYLGLDVRLLCQYRPDKWVPFFAGRYYWSDVMDAGVKVYQYTKGMMHSKLVLVDGEWASVGTANLDNRSLHLNFEVNCLIYSPTAVAELEKAFKDDLSASIRVQQEAFARRPFAGRLVENACRLLSPIL
ncbi:MAG TPA: cardiolipin synthase [Gemmataceae bacterium]|nr:cardiolipin synthase [Gemmataceae bacterium]